MGGPTGTTSRTRSVSPRADGRTVTAMSKSPPYPFVKWLGGKARMAGRVMSRLPSKIGLYGEPMIGGGAVFIELAKAGRFRKAVIADSNADLVNAWQTVRDDVKSLVKRLREYKYDRELYLSVREIDPASLDSVEAAARFIFLNRTCFNGIYRVNSEGKFNVPFGKYVNPVICDEPNLKAVSALLSGVEIRTQRVSDFLKAFHVGRLRGFGDENGEVGAVYVDPPYIPISETANFTSYTEDGFGMTDHVDLCKALRSLASRGVRVVASNSGTKAAIDLYSDGFDLDEVRGSRSVGGAGKSRKTVGEVIAFAGPRS